MTESTTSNMEDLTNKHDGTINTCWCEWCYQARKKRLQDETDRWEKEKQILLNKIYGTTADGAKGRDIEDNNVQVNMQTEVKIFKDHMDTANELITNREAVDVAKGQDINEVKLVNTTTPWDSQEMLTCSKQKPCRNETKLSQMKKDIRNKTVYITKEPQTVLYTKELNQNGHSKNICRNKLFCSSLKEEPPESQTLGHFWDKNWMPLRKNEFSYII